MGERERAQRYVEMYSDRCASLGPDNPWSHKMAMVQQTILDSIPTDPIASESEPTGEESESEPL
jgi:hypothetical protein